MQVNNFSLIPTLNVEKRFLKKTEKIAPGNGMKGFCFVWITGHGISQTQTVKQTYRLQITCNLEHVRWTVHWTVPRHLTEH